MAELATKKKTSLLRECVGTLHLPRLLTKLYLILHPSKKQTLKKQTLSMPDWSLLPEELVHIISKKLEDQNYCFDVVHARSVSRSWRSMFPFPSCLLRPSYSLPKCNLVPFPCCRLRPSHSLPKCNLERTYLSTLVKIPLFLFIVQTPHVAKYFLGGIGQDDEHHMELPSPRQCSVKLRFTRSDPTLMKMLECSQILPLGHQYRMIGWDPKYCRGAAFVPLNKEGEFVVFVNYTYFLMVLRSSEMRWTRLENGRNALCEDLVTFRGRCFATFHDHDILVIDPYSLEMTPLMTSEPPRDSVKYLVPSGSDELFLVELILDSDQIDYTWLPCRVSRLDEEAGKWVKVSDLGDLVLFIGQPGNVCFSAKELPDGCGLSGNSIVFTNRPHSTTFFYKYGVNTEEAEDNPMFWRLSKEDVTILNNLPPVMALRVES